MYSSHPILIIGKRHKIRCGPKWKLSPSRTAPSREGGAALVGYKCDRFGCSYIIKFLASSGQHTQCVWLELLLSLSLLSLLGKLSYLLAAVAAVPVVVCVLHGNYNYHWQVQLISTPGINRSNWSVVLVCHSKWFGNYYSRSNQYIRQCL